MLRFLACVIAVSPAIAAADDDLSLQLSRDPIMRILTGADLEHSLDLEAHAAVAGVAGRLTGAQATAGGEIAWSAGVCRPLFAGTEGTADKTRDGDQLSGSWWAGGCLPFAMNRVELTLRADYALQPRLAALPIAQRARYTGIGVEIKNTFIGWRSKTREHAILPLTFSINTLHQPMFDTGRGELVMAGYRRTDDTGRVLEILPISFRAAGPAVPAETGGFYLSTTAYEYAPLRILKTSAGSLGPFTLDADFVAGLAYADITKPPVGGMQMAPVLYDKYDLYADTTVRATRGEDTIALHLRRAFEPTYTDELLLDTRGELSWYRVHGKHGVLLGLFGAVTRRMDRDGPVDSTPSGGVRGVYNYTLPGHMQLALSGEVARSFYATLDDTLATDAAWSGQVNAALSFAIKREKGKVATP